MSIKTRAWRFGAGLALGAFSFAATGCAEEPPRPAAYPAAPSMDAADYAADGEPTDDAAYAQEPAGYDASTDRDPSALEDFREPLAPYGTWVDDATYGTVWIPSTSVVGDDFAPYVTAGHWGMTDGGQWIWASDYSWGWAPFHYGRWVWVGGRGWAWIPGRVYAPAWVVWRTGYYDDYYVGWAPMPPTWYWRSGVAVSLGFYPSAPYVFCSSRYVFSPGLRTAIVPASRVRVVAASTRPYVPAHASLAGHFAATRGPTLADAHVPANVAPARVAHDPRALGFARPVPGARLVPHALPSPAARGMGVPGAAARPSFGAPPAHAGAPSIAPRPFPTSPGPQRITPRPYAPLPAAPQPITPRAFPTQPSIQPRTFGTSPGAIRPMPAPMPRPTFRPSVPAPAVRGGGRHR